VDGSVKVANEPEFINEFRRRANDSFWKTLECIQTAIKSKIGLGKHFFIPFKVEIKDKSKAECELKYNYKKPGQEYEKEVQEIADREMRQMFSSEMHKEIEERLRLH
jgi:hypothetical protein